MTSIHRTFKLLSAVLVALGTSGAALAQRPAQTPPQPTPTPPAPQQQAPVQPTVQLPTTLPGTPQNTPAQPQPRPFDSVVREATEIPGFFTLYEKEDRVWLELKPEQFNKPFYLSINRTRGLGENFIYPFMMRGYVVEFRKVGNLVQMIAKNTRYMAKEGTPLARAAEQSFTDSLLASGSIVSSPHPERKSVLVEANGFFITDLPGDSTTLEST